SAERQFRLPLAYGGQRTPTAQWTATAAGALIIKASGDGPFVTHVTTGKIVDGGICDAANMGAAMAPAALETLCTHFADTGRKPTDYDLIVTGDLGVTGHEILLELALKNGLDLAPVCDDCGMMIYDREKQDVHAGGSGCGCSASVLAGHLLPQVKSGKIKRLLFAATGALMSPTTALQGESILGICHAVAIDFERGTK
ncbi:MAG: stage V sporulation protein AD, partial [Oscillospiraceae bacterium]